MISTAGYILAITLFPGLRVYEVVDLVRVHNFTDGKHKGFEQNPDQGSVQQVAGGGRGTPLHCLQMLPIHLAMCICAVSCCDCYFSGDLHDSMKV